MKKIRAAILFNCLAIFISISQCAGQAAPSWTSADMYLAIRKLNVLGSVLYLAAHPDDENTRLISYFSKDRMFRTGYLSLTRGDGGQNLIGEEQGIELGLIRTQELLAARRIDGGEQFFSRAFDFGYSKNPEETFTKWHHDKILSDVVWIIRKFQPDVIITRFPTTGEGGHGHHTASAILANEAFTAAADRSQFPEQLKFVQPWQVKRVLWNTFNFGNTNTTSADQFKFDVGGYNPLLGKSYGEIAAISRSNHKSQGFGSAASRGEAIEFFKTTAGTPPVSDIMDGTDLTWKKVPGGHQIEKLVDSLAASFDLLHPEKSVKGLVRLYQALNGMSQSYWRDQKLNETLQLIEQCAGLFMDATTTEQFAVQTDSIRVNFLINNRLGANAILNNVSLNNFDSNVNATLPKNKNFIFSKSIYVAATDSVTQPYWLANKMEEGYFNVSDLQKIGQPDVDPAFVAKISVNIEGQLFNFLKPVKFKFTDPVRGELYQPLVIVPPMLVRPDASVKISKDAEGFAGDLRITSKKRSAYISPLVAFDGSATGIKTEVSPKHLQVLERNRTYEANYKVQSTRDGEYIFSAYDSVSKTTADHDLYEIRHDHIPYINYYVEARVLNRRIDLKTHNKKIGYIVGAGDKVPEALDQMGYDVTLLTEKELSRNNLQQFDAIMAGVRAYNVNDWLNKYYDKLVKYVHEGGNFIVQYNTVFRNVVPKIGPYKFDIVNKRVSDENAPVSFLKPDHPVLNFPNKINGEDFKGWVQERSIYHASAWDSTKFETMLALNDPGEKADQGSLIIGRHGKGVFVYTGLVFFRELPAGVPGAYRLLANIIALNRKKGF